MTVFRVQVHYRLGVTGKWSNVWHGDAADILTAAVGFEIGGVPSLLELLHPDCVLDHLLVSDPATDAFIVRPISAFGTSATSGERLPLFNAIKVIIPTPGFGRPDLKYIKGFLTEGMQDDGQLETAIIGSVDTTLTNMLASLSTEGVTLCSFEGDAYTNFSIDPPVAMRQMHRKRRRASTTTPTP